MEPPLRIAPLFLSQVVSGTFSSPPRCQTCKTSGKEQEGGRLGYSRPDPRIVLTESPFLDDHTHALITRYLAAGTHHSRIEHVEDQVSRGNEY